MYCKNCGNHLEENAKFCDVCGAMTEGHMPDDDTVEQPQEQTQEQPQEQPQQPQEQSQQPVKKKKGGMLAGVLIGAVLMLALIIGALFLLGVIGGGNDVTEALEQTTQAFDDVAEELGLGETAELIEEQKYSMDFELRVDEVMDAEPFSGLGLRVMQDHDLEGKKYDLQVVPFYGAADLITAQLSLEDTKLFIGLDELFSNVIYGVDTANLGEELSSLGALGLPDMSQYNFDMFRVIEAVRSSSVIDEESEEAIREAGRQLLEVLEIEEMGKQPVQVNGYDITCKQYNVVLTQQTMREYVEQLQLAMEDYNLPKLIENIYDAMDLTEDVRAQLNADLYENVGDMDLYNEIFEQLYMMVETIGDIEMQLYIDDGYLMAVRMDETISDLHLVVRVDLGGGKNYVDDLSICVDVNDGEAGFELTSNGNHACENGEFSDRTVLRMGSAELVSDMTYAYTASSDNFDWTVSGADVQFVVSGYISSGKDKMSVELDQIALKEEGQTLVELSALYRIGRYEQRLQPQNVKMLSEMSQMELLSLVTTIGVNAESWTSDMVDQLADVLEMIGY